jgi:hypothetical protein
MLQMRPVSGSELVAVEGGDLWNTFGDWGWGTIAGYGLGTLFAPEFTLPLMLWGGAMGGMYGLWSDPSMFSF